MNIATLDRRHFLQNTQSDAPDRQRWSLVKRFVKAEDLELPKDWHMCLHRILKGRCSSHESCRPLRDIPHYDHGDLWRRRDDGSYVLTFQPYSFVDWKRDDLDAFCRQDGLQWKELPELSWHYPRKTTLVVVEAF